MGMALAGTGLWKAFSQDFFNQRKGIKTMKKRMVAILLALVLMVAFSANALALDQALRGVKVYGGSPSKVVVSNAARQYSNFSMTIYGDSNFNSESNMTFRCYRVNDSSAKRSNAISFYLDNWYSGQSRTVSFINGGSEASALDLRGSVPSTNSTAYAWFYGYVRF